MKNDENVVRKCICYCNFRFIFVLLNYDRLFFIFYFFFGRKESSTLWKKIIVILINASVSRIFFFFFFSGKGNATSGMLENNFVMKVKYPRERIRSHPGIWFPSSLFHSLFIILRESAVAPVTRKTRLTWKFWILPEAFSKW